MRRLAEMFIVGHVTVESSDVVRAGHASALSLHVVQKPLAGEYGPLVSVLLVGSVVGLQLGTDRGELGFELRGAPLKRLSRPSRRRRWR